MSAQGGYLLTKLIRNCTLRTWLNQATHVVTVGSEMLKGPLESQPASLAGCGELTMMVDEKDEHNFDPTGNLLKALRGKNANVREVRFDGGHLLTEAPLEQVLSSH